MRKLIGGMAAVAVLITLPALADGQRRPAPRPAGGAKHEFGVDVGLGYYDPDGGQAGFVIASPLDVRVGFVSAKKLQWEGRLVFQIDSKGVGTGQGIHNISPGVNAVYAMTPGGNRNGMYLTGGAGLNLRDIGVASGTGFSLNGAVGWRKPYGNSAFRYEVGIKWDSQIKDNGVVFFPRILTIGGRVGISFWH